MGAKGAAFWGKEVKLLFVLPTLCDSHEICVLQNGLLVFTSSGLVGQNVGGALLPESLFSKMNRTYGISI